MTQFQDILNQLSQLSHMDKATWGALAYTCYLYMMATLPSHSRHNYRRHRH